MAGAFGVVFHRSIVYSALMLIVVFLSIAGIFVLNNADFLAIAQTIVYGVGLTIIILFGVMFTGDRPELNKPPVAWQVAAYYVVGLMVLALLLSGALQAYPEQALRPEWIATLQAEGTTRTLGLALFQNHVLAFELASVLLLLAMVGAIVLAKKHFEGEPLPTQATKGDGASSRLPVSAVDPTPLSPSVSGKENASSASDMRPLTGAGRNL